MLKVLVHGPHLEKLWAAVTWSMGDSVFKPGGLDYITFTWHTSFLLDFPSHRRFSNWHSAALTHLVYRENWFTFSDLARGLSFCPDSILVQTFSLAPSHFHLPSPTIESYCSHQPSLAPFLTSPFSYTILPSALLSPKSRVIIFPTLWIEVIHFLNPNHSSTLGRHMHGWHTFDPNIIQNCATPEIPDSKNTLFWAQPPRLCNPTPSNLPAYQGNASLSCTDHLPRLCRALPGSLPGWPSLTFCHVWLDNPHYRINLKNHFSIHSPQRILAMVTSPCGLGLLIHSAGFPYFGYPIYSCLSDSQVSNPIISNPQICSNTSHSQKCCGL